MGRNRPGRLIRLIFRYISVAVRLSPIAESGLLPDALSRSVHHTGWDEPSDAVQKILATSKSVSRRPPERRRILIVDDHPLMRRGLTVLIDNEHDLKVCAEAATPSAGFEAIASSRPDLVITDLSMSDDDNVGLSLVEKIRRYYALLPVLVLTIHEAPHYARRAMLAGANGYLSKQELGETLLIAIRCLLNGENYFGPKMSLRLNRK